MRSILCIYYAYKLYDITHVFNVANNKIFDI